MAEFSEPATFKNFRKAIYDDWTTAMSGAFSVPFTALAVWVDSKFATFFWAAMAICAFGYAAYRLWSHERTKVVEWEDRARPKINAHWRFRDGRAQLILQNSSINTIDGIEVMFRNWQRPDQAEPNDLICHLKTIDGAQNPISLNPGIPYYFEFAGVALAGNGNTIIVLMPGSDRGVQVGQEVVVKLSFSGHNLGYQPIDFRVMVGSDNKLSIESRDSGRPAVSPAGVGA